MEKDFDGLLCAYEGVVEYERSETWPPELIALFESESVCLEAYEHRRADVDAICREDVMARINPPPNAHKQQRDEVVQWADAILTAQLLLCFHCTRLTEAELAGIRAGGLRLLSPALVRERLKQVVTQGLLTQDLMSQLLESHQADHDNRVGTIHFVNCRSILAHENAVGRLFRSWGGEALYNSHETRHDTGLALRRIGKPAIIIAAKPVPKLRTSFDNVGERFLWKFLSDRNVPIDQAPNIETHSMEPVPANMVLDIIAIADSRFEQLTRCSTWSKPIG